MAKRLIEIVLCCFSLGALAQAPVPEITVEKINDHLFMIVGLGGNVGVSVGDDGTFIIDDQMQPIIPKLQAAITELANEPVKLVLNTHWHFDHTGGNEVFGETGAVIVAHDNVRERMSTEQVSTFFGSVRPPSPDAALPVVTFAEDVTLHFNGDTVRVFHVPNAHTDGDAIVHFVESNVWHLGDTYFSSFYPFFDLDSGGSINGMIASASRILELMNDEAKIIPGHGPITGRDTLRDYRDMMITVRDRVQALIDEGADTEAVIAAAPTADFDERWNGSGEFMPPGRWLTLITASLRQEAGE